MPTITIGGVVSSYNLSNNAPSSNDYYGVPTNAKLTLGSYATDDKLFTIIYEVNKRRRYIFYHNLHINVIT